MTALDDYIAARTARDAAAQAKKQAEEAFRRAERALVDSLVDQSLKSQKDSQNRHFILAPKLNFSVRQTDVEKVLGWLDSIGKDADQFKRDQIIKKRLKEVVAEQFEAAGEEGVPSFLKLDTTPGITVRGWKETNEEEDDDE